MSVVAILDYAWWGVGVIEGGSMRTYHELISLKADA
jgi:hypothetical protein